MGDMIVSVAQVDPQRKHPHPDVSDHLANMTFLQVRRKHLFFFAIAHRLETNKMFYDNKRAEKRVSCSLGTNDNVVDGNMDEFNEETNKTHDGKADGSRHSDLLKLYSRNEQNTGSSDDSRG
jgi:hypothetical protein